MVLVRAYEAEDGSCPFRNWFAHLDHQAAERVDEAMRRLALGNFGDHTRVGAGVIELRIDFGPGYRIYFGKDGNKLVILLAGGTKKRQGRDIATAHELWKEYKRRKRKGET